MTDGAEVTVEVPIGIDPALTAFIYLEARLADEARYDEWEALWADEARYWVPRHEDTDSEHACGTLSRSPPG